MSLLLQIIAIICLLASITVYFQPGSELYLKLFPVFLFITNVVQDIGLFLSMHNEANVVLYNIFSIIELFFYFFTLREIIRNNKMKKVILYILCIYPLFELVYIFLIKGTSNFHSISYALGVLLVVGFGIYYFFELFQLPNSKSLLREPAFWICTAIVFNYCATFSFSSLIIFIHNPTRFMYTNLVIIQNIVSIFSYFLFTIAFLCRIKIRKSISSS